jgi:hypothetical protein
MSKKKANHPRRGGLVMEVIFGTAIASAIAVVVQELRDGLSKELAARAQAYLLDMLQPLLHELSWLRVTFACQLVFAACTFYRAQLARHWPWQVFALSNFSYYLAPTFASLPAPLVTINGSLMRELAFLMASSALLHLSSTRQADKSLARYLLAGACMLALSVVSAAPEHAHAVMVFVSMFGSFAVAVFYLAHRAQLSTLERACWIAYGAVLLCRPAMLNECGDFALAYYVACNFKWIPILAVVTRLPMRPGEGGPAGERSITDDSDCTRSLITHA